ncbi:MAG: MerR family transcriptional regulator [Clostridia bacterium]|nr:MerR family transcriptional regulator [Clostridia bacterium]
MKIKTVCELTDLSDRAVRHYIQEGLIAPAYSENYLGRRAFDFSDADVRMLKDVAVLRKFGFSIPEIRQVQENPWNSWEIAQNLRERKRELIESEQTMLDALSGLEAGKAYTVAELATILSAPVRSTALPAADEQRSWKTELRLIWKDWILSPVKTVGIGTITVLPLIAIIWRVIQSFKFYLYPILNSFALLLTVVALLPSVAVLMLVILDRDKIFRKTRYALVVICVLCIPSNQFFSLFIFNSSETTEPFNYRRVDQYCTANRDPFYYALFPWKMDDSLMFEPNWKPRYYYGYYNFLGEVSDIYAEWQLTQEALEQERLRIAQLWKEDQRSNIASDSDKYQYITMQKGSYTCFIKYKSLDYNDCDPNDPFAGNGIRDHYVYYIFAYDDDTNTVRYITCYGEDAAQPYFLELDW